MKVLVIDDDFATRKSFDYILKTYECDVLEAAEGKDGIAKAKSEKPQLVLVDTILPDMDGNEVCRQIKDADAAIKVVVFTGVVDAVNAEKARAAGADDYVVKTSDLTHIIKSAKEMMTK